LQEGLAATALPMDTLSCSYLLQFCSAKEIHMIRGWRWLLTL